MFEHRQRFTAIQLHGELGAQLMEPRMALQGVEDLSGEGAGVETHLPVEAGSRAEHQSCAHRRPPRVRGPSPAASRLSISAADCGPMPRTCRLARLVASIDAAGKALGGIGSPRRPVRRVIEPPSSLIRQMPPSSAWTIRSNPGQAEGRMAVDIGRSFKGRPAG
jgi:hypothetical protein